MKVLRKFTSQALRDFGVGKTSLEDKIYHEIDATIHHLDNENGEPVDITLLSSKMITNIIYHTVPLTWDHIFSIFLRFTTSNSMMSSFSFH